MCSFCSNFAAELRKEANMITLQLNADIYRNLGIIAEDENVLRRVAKCLTRVVK